MHLGWIGCLNKLSVEEQNQVITNVVRELTYEPREVFDDDKMETIIKLGIELEMVLKEREEQVEYLSNEVEYWKAIANAFNSK